MKTCFFLAVFVFRFMPAVQAQAAVTVDAGHLIKPLSGIENGINLNYLTDGSYLNPNIPLSTSLKNMGVKLVRYPGGEKSDNYLWSAAPWSAAAPRMALTNADNCWPTGDARFVDQASPEKQCKPAVLDFDELMVLCKKSGAQPLIVVAYDAMYHSATAERPTKEQLITNAAEWVRYANITKSFDIKYWMIGNESWNLPDYNGRTTPAQYAADLVDFASAMKAVDPEIKIIANGKSSWWQTLLQSPAVSLIDILAFSSYPVYNYTDGYQTYRNSTRSLTREAAAAVKAINLYAPAADRERLTVLASEYNSMDWSGGWSNDNDLGHALCNFQMFGDMVSNPKVEGACLWNTRWIDNTTAEQHIYDALDKNGNLNATGTAQQVWGKNLLQAMVATTSSDALVKAYASYDTVTQNLNVFLLNKDTTAKTVDLSIKNYVAGYGGSKFVFGRASVSDKFPTFSWAGGISDPAATASVTLQPASVTVLNLLADFVHLPVKLTSFTGVAAKAGIQLKWQSENDYNLLHYIVERRVNNGAFEGIGLQNVPAHQTLTTAYSFLDSNTTAAAPNDYRLKMVRKNGRVSYSEVLKFAPATIPEPAIAIAPNPVRNRLQLHVVSAVSQTLLINIADASGRTWAFEKVAAAAGTSVVTLNAGRSLPPGTYWLQVQAKGQQKILPFVKL